MPTPAERANAVLQEMAELLAEYHRLAREAEIQLAAEFPDAELLRRIRDGRVAALRRLHRLCEVSERIHRDATR